MGTRACGGAAVLLVLLAACGGSTADSGSGPAAEPEPAAEAELFASPGPTYFGESLQSVATRAGCTIDPELAANLPTTTLPDADAQSVECTLTAAGGAEVSLSVSARAAAGYSNGGGPPSGIKVFTGRYYASGPGYDAYPLENRKDVAEAIVRALGGSVRQIPPPPPGSDGDSDGDGVRDY